MLSFKYLLGRQSKKARRDLERQLLKQLEHERIEKRKKIMEQQRNRKRKQREQEQYKAFQIEASENKFNHASEEEFLRTTKEFDKLNELLIHKRCSCCRKVRLDMKVERQSFANITHLLCCSCKHYSLNEIKQVQSVLPVWQNDQKQKCSSNSQQN